MMTETKMMKIIYVAIGGNLIPDGYDSLYEGLEAAIKMLPAYGCPVQKVSSYYITAPVPVSDQPDYLNAVLMCTTELSAAETLANLHKIESQFGRVRSVRNAARVLDLDLIDYDGEVFDSNNLQIPHPRMPDRAFVLYPLLDVAPSWQHPQTGLDVATLIAQLPEGQSIRRIADEAG